MWGSASCSSAIGSYRINQTSDRFAVSIIADKDNLIHSATLNDSGELIINFSITPSYSRLVVLNY